MRRKAKLIKVMSKKAFENAIKHMLKLGKERKFKEKEN
jgi:hypothetical protein